jgi:tellurite resistance protein TerC
VTDGYEGQKFFVRRNRVLYITPLFLVLLVIEASDVMFAVDSIPAIFAITDDPFIVFTSNIFAILGLRALYFLLHGAIGELTYLKPALAAVLVFVGAKMLLSDVLHVHPLISLGVIVGILAVAVAASLARAKVRLVAPAVAPAAGSDAAGASQDV